MKKVKPKTKNPKPVDPPKTIKLVAKIAPNWPIRLVIPEDTKHPRFS